MDHRRSPGTHPCTAHNHTPPALPCGYYKVKVAVSPSQASVPKLSREECLAWSGTALPSSPEACETLASKRCATLLLVAYLTLAFPEWYTPRCSSSHLLAHSSFFLCCLIEGSTIGRWWCARRARPSPPGRRTWRTSRPGRRPSFGSAEPSPRRPRNRKGKKVKITAGGS